VSASLLEHGHDELAHGVLDLYSRVTMIV